MTRLVMQIVLAMIASFTVAEASIVSTPPSLAIRDGRVAASVTNVPIEWVVAALGEKTGAVFHGVDALGERRMTITLTDVPLREALERLLAPASFTMTFDQRGRLARVVILGGARAAPRPAEGAPRAEPADDAPFDVQAPDEAALVADAHGAPEAVERIEALSLLGQRMHTPAAGTTMADVLRDEADADVRRIALTQLESAGRAPLKTMIDVARYDPDGDLRARALEALAGQGDDAEARATIAWMADNDSDPRVRQIAADVLAELPRPGDGGARRRRRGAR